MLHACLISAHASDIPLVDVVARVHIVERELAPLPPYLTSDNIPASVSLSLSLVHGNRFFFSSLVAREPTLDVWKHFGRTQGAHRGAWHYSRNAEL